MQHRLGSLTLGETPRVALALRDTDDGAAVTAALGRGADILELRVDQFAEHTAAYGRAVIGGLPEAPRLLTVRGAAEGGGWRGPEAGRAALYRALMPLAQAVDIEIAATEIFPEVVAAAREEKALVVGSHHDFEATPDLAELGDIAAAAYAQGADVAKVAAQCNTPEDLRTLAAFCLGWRHRGVIVIGMGADAMLSRVFFPALGSLITYTFLGAATAPGQLNCEDTLRYIDAFYPARGA